MMQTLLSIDRSNWVKPCYAGGSIANIPATVAALLSAPPSPGLPALESELWERYRPARRVIVLVLDAVNHRTFVQHFGHPAAGQAQAISSVFPSTTVSALSSLWTGLAPAQHGLLGTRMWLREYGLLAQMISLKAARRGYTDQLVDMGFKPESFLPSPNLPEHLATAGIPTHDFIPRYLKDSGLTQILHRGVPHIHPVVNLTDALCKLRALLEAAPGQPLYAHLYHSDVDTLAHFDGPGTPAIAAELGLAAYLIQHELIDTLSSAAAQDTLLIITADHGQLYTPLERGIALHKHPELWQHLCMPPSGEPRAAYLFVRDGHKPAARDYIERELAYGLEVIDTRTALEAGLWGPAPHHPQLEERLGDLVVLPRENYWLVDAFGETHLFLGWHGGLSEDEMRVPLCIIKLQKAKKRRLTR
ncbi:MAG: alkaline phosphatase family protein [Thermoflexales bacterium]|nr:alkaline phosphatase family protein [Thermoflexales bacterium]